MDESPVEQVRLTVPNTDDPSLPVWTFRMWTIGLLFCFYKAILAWNSWKMPLENLEILSQHVLCVLYERFEVLRLLSRFQCEDFPMFPNNFITKVGHFIIIFFINLKKIQFEFFGNKIVHFVTNVFVNLDR